MNEQKNKRKDSDAAYNNFLKSGFLEETMKKNKDKGSTYRRIVKANKAAKKRGISYGRYMAGLWEDRERTPICKEIAEKPKKEPERILLTGDDAAEYIKQLKIKAGTWEEPEVNRDESMGPNSRKKVDMFNKEWTDICKHLMPYREKLKNVYLV